MIQKLTRIIPACNSGAKSIMCIGLLNKEKYGRIGSVFTATVKSAKPGSKVKKGDIVKAILIRSKKEMRRSDGRYIRFDENAAVLLQHDRVTMMGTRVLGPVPVELRQKWPKLVALASRIV